MAREMSEERELMLFQDYFPHLAAPVTDKERKQIRFYLDLQENMKNGWLSKAIEQLHAKNAERAVDHAKYNAFEDVPQYGMKKRSASERVPRFSDFPFGKRLAVSVHVHFCLLTSLCSEGAFSQGALGCHRSEGRVRRSERAQEEAQTEHKVEPRQAGRFRR